MQVRDVMHKTAKFINLKSSLMNAAKVMKAEGVGCLPVEDNDRMVGMLTDRDIVLKAIAEEKDFAKMKVEDCMSKGIHFVYEDIEIPEACRKLAKMRVRRLPVINGKKRLVGMLSIEDIAASMVDDQLFHETLCSIALPSEKANGVKSVDKYRTQGDEINSHKYYDGLPESLE